MELDLKDSGKEFPEKDLLEEDLSLERIGAPKRELG